MINKKTLQVILLVIILFIMAAATVHSASLRPTTYTAEITRLKDPVFLKRQASGKWTKIFWTKGDPEIEVSLGDVIKTGFQGKVEMTLSNGTLIRLAEYSTVIIEDSPSYKDEQKHTSIKLMAGGIWNKVKKTFIDKDQTISAYKVESPVAVAAVKGTLFTMSYEDERTEVNVYEGIVEVKNKLGRVVISPNFSTIVTAKLPPTLPRPAAPEKKDMWEWTKISRLGGIRFQEDEEGQYVIPEDIKKMQRHTPGLIRLEKSAPWAALQSFLIPGGGEFYVGQPFKGALAAIIEGTYLYLAIQEQNRASEFPDQADAAKEKEGQYFMMAAGIASLTAIDSYFEALAHNARLYSVGLQFREGSGLALAYTGKF